MEIITVRDFRNNMKDYMTNTEDGKIYRVGTRDTLLISHDTIDKHVQSIRAAINMQEALRSLESIFDQTDGGPGNHDSMIGALESFLTETANTLAQAELGEKEMFDARDVTHALSEDYDTTIFHHHTENLIHKFKDLFAENIFDVDEQITIKDVLTLIANISRLPEVYLIPEYSDNEYLVYLSELVRELGYGKPLSSFDKRTTFVKSYVESYL